VICYFFPHIIIVKTVPGTDNWTGNRKRTITEAFGQVKNTSRNWSSLR